jgi:hypothetical protein
MDHQDVKQAASKAADHPALEAVARVGYAVSGLLHLLIGWITLQVAFGGSGKNADQSGALASLAGNGAGKAALWIGVIGFLFVTAGFHKQAQEATGLDGALTSLRDEPFGTVLLVVMALGFAAFGLYSFSRAKHAKV